MKIKYGDTRVVFDNLTTYSVSRKEKDGKVRFALFFNFVGGGYKELIAFKTQEKARCICNIIDNSGMDMLNDSWVTVVNRETKQVVRCTDGYKTLCGENYNLDGNFVLNPDYHYFYCENILDIGEIITAFGWEKSVVIVNDRGGE